MMIINEEVRVNVPKLKQRILPPPLLAIVISIGIASAFGQLVQRDDDPNEASPMDAVIDQTKADNFSLFGRLSAVDQAKIIRRLKDRIAVQDKPDEPYALAVGKLLVKMHAEQPLHDLIVALSKENFGNNSEIVVCLDALSFMKTKAAVRALASFLYDKDDLAFQEEVRLLKEMDEKGKAAYLNAHPHLRLLLTSCMITGNIEMAVYYLFRMNIPGAPKLEPISGTMQEGDIKKWREWWEVNEEKFQEDGPVPTE